MTPERRTYARRKRRSFQHLMEEESGHILRASLPEEWVIHEYSPDYGIDGTVEMFAYVDDSKEYAEALGETVFFQLKSGRSCDARSVMLEPRMNVEKMELQRGYGEPCAADVVLFQLETDELLTIEAMGSGVVVLLFLVCLDTKQTYFVSLTDYIDKILSPESPDWREQRTKQIRIPALNRMTPDTELETLLRFYGARPKLMGLFQKIHFQAPELRYGLNELDPARWLQMVLHFAAKLLTYDVWDHPAWIPMLGGYKGKLEALAQDLRGAAPETVYRDRVVMLWDSMDAISRTFEEIAREWGLPTWIGHSSSYPPSWLRDSAAGAEAPNDAPPSASAATE